jgi:hypothetical protein
MGLVRVFFVSNSKKACGDVVDNDAAAEERLSGDGSWLKGAVVDKRLVSCLEVVDRGLMVLVVYRAAVSCVGCG